MKKLIQRHEDTKEYQYDIEDRITMVKTGIFLASIVGFLGILIVFLG